MKRTERPPLSASAYADQSYYIQIQRNLNAQFEIDHDRKRRFMIMTYGCQMNIADSEVVASILSEQFQITESQKEADLILINTCSVRDNAEQRIRKRLKEMGALKRNNPNLIIGLLG